MKPPPARARDLWRFAAGAPISSCEAGRNRANCVGDFVEVKPTATITAFYMATMIVKLILHWPRCKDVLPTVLDFKSAREALLELERRRRIGMAALSIAIQDEDGVRLVSPSRLAMMVYGKRKRRLSPS